MTTVVRQFRRAPGIDTRDARTIVLAWTLSPEAASAAGITVAGSSLRMEIEALWPPALSSLRARIVSDDGVQDYPIGTHTIQWITDSAASLIHLEAPGVLHATLRISRGDVEVLYTRNLLMRELNIGGGRYDFHSAAPCC
jgi:hypothetical protein